VTAPLATLIFALAGFTALWALVETVWLYGPQIRAALHGRPHR
jgi:hypothetical protein